MLGLTLITAAMKSWPIVCFYCNYEKMGASLQLIHSTFFLLCPRFKLNLSNLTRSIHLSILGVST